MSPPCSPPGWLRRPHWRVAPAGPEAAAAQPRPPCRRRPAPRRARRPPGRRTPGRSRCRGRPGRVTSGPGSDPAALPGDLLIADKKNNRLLIVDPHGRIRWRFPRKGDLEPGQTFKIPDDAFFSPDGRRIVATEEDDFVIRVIDIRRHRIVYTYGKPGASGEDPTGCGTPTTPFMLPDGRIVTADIKNQRVLVIGPAQPPPQEELGQATTGYHDPPAALWRAQRRLPDGPRALPGHRDPRRLGRRHRPARPRLLVYARARVSCTPPTATGSARTGTSPSTTAARDRS